MDACDIADVLDGVRGRLETATGEGCGLPVAAAGYERMRQAWLAELAAHAAVLREACDGQ